MESLARIKDDPDFTFYESRLSSDIPEHSLGSYVRIKSEPEYDINMDAMTTVRHEFNFYHAVGDTMDASHLNNSKLDETTDFFGFNIPTHYDNIQLTNDVSSCGSLSLDDPNMVRMCDVRLENFDTAFKMHHSSPLHQTGSVDLEQLHLPNDGRPAFECEICKKPFTLLQHLRIHMHIHDGDHTTPTFRCDICGNTYLQEGQLGAHITACHTLVVVPPPAPPTLPTLPPTPPQLEYPLMPEPHEPLPSIIKQEFIILKEEYAPMPGVAQLEYTVPVPELAPPMQQQSLPPPPPPVPSISPPAEVPSPPKQTFLCTICGQAYRQQRNLTAHMQVHTNNQEFKCEVCPKTFSQMSSMKIHKNVHNSDKPYKCDQCSKSYTQLTNLKIHMNTHTGGRPFKCEVCGKTFSQISSLKTHKHGHTGDKPHKCTICSKAYTQSSSLKVHMNIHNGHKPYKCEVCEKTFSDPSNFRKHKSTTHGI